MFYTLFSTAFPHPFPYTLDEGNAERRALLFRFKMALLFFDNIYFPLRGSLTSQMFAAIHADYSEYGQQDQVDSPRSVIGALQQLYQEGVIRIAGLDKINDCKSLVDVAKAVSANKNAVSGIRGEQLIMHASRMASVFRPLIESHFSERDFRHAAWRHVESYCYNVLASDPWPRSSINTAFLSVMSFLKRCDGQLSMSQLGTFLRSANFAIDADTFTRLFAALEHQYFHAAMTLWERANKQSTIWHACTTAAPLCARSFFGKNDASEIMAIYNNIEQRGFVGDLLKHLPLSKLVDLRKTRPFAKFRQLIQRESFNAPSTRLVVYYNAVREAIKHAIENDEMPPSADFQMVVGGAMVVQGLLMTDVKAVSQGAIVVGEQLLPQHSKRIGKSDWRIGVKDILRYRNATCYELLSTHTMQTSQ